MHHLLKIGTAVLVGFLLTTPIQAGHGGHGGPGHHGPVGHGPVGHGHVGHGRIGHGPRFGIRHHGLFSHRHWDRRHRRWMYFHPGYRHWYSRPAVGASWTPVDDADDPGVPTDDSDE